MRSLFIAAFALATVAFAQPYESEPTPSNTLQNAAHHELTIKPTAAPNFELVKRRLEDSGVLQRRAASSGSIIGYAGLDNTCGYINGELGTTLRQ